MLIRLPFDVDGDNDGHKHYGTVWVDPQEVACVSRGFDRVVILLKSGQICASRKPELKTAMLAGTPDNATLDKWADDVIAMCNGASRKRGAA